MGQQQRRLLLSLLITLLLAWPAGAQAQGPIEASSEAELASELPRRLFFRARASSSAGDLIRARLFFRPTGSSTRISEPIQFEPAPSVELEHEWQMQLNGMPPGAEIEYWWELEDSAGNTLDVPRQTIVALDPRFDWQVIEDEELAITWYDGNEAWGQQMFDVGKAALTELQAELGSEITHQVRLVAYASGEDFRGAFPPQQEWIGGQAFPDLGVTVQIIGAGDEEWMITVLYHELSHLVFHQAMEGALASAPSWLDEGLAMYNEPGGRGSEIQVEQAARDGELLAFSQLQGNFGADGRTVGLAYAQSEMLVSYLIEDCGDEGFRQFIQNMVDDMTVDNALEAACGYPSQALYDAWRQTLPNPPVPTEPAPPAGGETLPDPVEPIQEPAAAPSIPPGLLIFIVGGLCLAALLGLAILAIVIRLLRPSNESM